MPPQGCQVAIELLIGYGFSAESAEADGVASGAGRREVPLSGGGAVVDARFRPEVIGATTGGVGALPEVGDSLAMIDGILSGGVGQFERISPNDLLTPHGSLSEKIDTGSATTGDVSASLVVALETGSLEEGATATGGGAAIDSGALAVDSEGSVSGTLSFGGVEATTGDCSRGGKGDAAPDVLVRRSTARPKSNSAAAGAAQSACFRQRGTVRGGIVHGSVVAANGSGVSSSSKISARSAIRSIGV